MVVAHLSEGIPRFWLLDNSALETFVENELQLRPAGGRRGQGARPTSTPPAGIQTQAYATSVLATLRKGLTKLETAGYAAGAIVLHPPKPGPHYAVLDASDDVVRLAKHREPLTARRAPGSTRGLGASGGMRDGLAAAAAPRPGQCIHRCFDRCRGYPGPPARCPQPGLAYRPRWRGHAPHPWGTGLPVQACWSLVRRRRRPPGRPRSRPRIHPQGLVVVLGSE